MAVDPKSMSTMRYPEKHEGILKINAAGRVLKFSRKFQISLIVDALIYKFSYFFLARTFSSALSDLLHLGIDDLGMTLSFKVPTEYSF